MAYARFNSGQRGVTPSCSQMTGAHLQTACATARQYGRGKTADDLVKWMEETGFNWKTNKFEGYDPTFSTKGTGPQKGVLPRVPAAGSVPTSPGAPGGPSGADGSVPDYILAPDADVAYQTMPSTYETFVPPASSGGVVGFIDENKLVIGGALALLVGGYFVKKKFF